MDFYQRQYRQGQGQSRPAMAKEISMIRQTRCPQINYEEKERPGEYKRRLCAEDVILGRYKYIPVSASTIKEKSMIRRQKKLVSHVKKSGKPVPPFLLPIGGKDEKENIHNYVKAPSPMVEIVICEENDDNDNDNNKKESKSPREQSVKSGSDENGDNDDNDDIFDDSSDNDDKEETDGFGEYVSYLTGKKRDRRLGSDDFDTDLDTSETDEEPSVGE